jgi:hypothetical protein
MSKRTEHIHLRVTPALKRKMQAATRGRKSKTVNGLVIEILTAALGPTES